MTLSTGSSSRLLEIACTILIACSLVTATPAVAKKKKTEQGEDSAEELQLEGENGKLRFIVSTREKPPKRAKEIHGNKQDLEEFRARGLGVIEAPALEEYLGSIARQLIRKSDLPPIKVHPRLVPDIGFGAEVSADRNLYIDMSLLLWADDEDVVAAVLAHEVAHLLLGHPNRKAYEKRQEQMLALSRAVIDANTALAHFGVKKEVTKKTTGRDYQDIAYRLNRDVITPGWGRSQELDADRLAIDLLSEAGYDPQALMAYLGAIKDRADDSKRMTDLALKARAELIKESMDTFIPETESTGHSLLDVLQDVAVESAESVAADTLADIGKSHPKPGKRFKKAMRYLSREDFMLDIPDRRVAEWKSVIEEPATATLLENYEAAYALQSEMATADPQTLDRLARQAVSRPTENHPFPRYVVHQFKMRQGRLAEAEGELNRAIESDFPSGTVTNARVELLLGQGRTQEASDLTEQQWRRMNKASPLYPLLIRTRMLSNQPKKAQAIARKCGKTNLQGRECERAMRLAQQSMQQPPPVAARPPQRPGTTQNPPPDQNEAKELADQLEDLNDQMPWMKKR